MVEPLFVGATTFGKCAERGHSPTERWVKTHRARTLKVLKNLYAWGEGHTDLRDYLGPLRLGRKLSRLIA
jgi:hypothetical protein